MLVRRCWPRSWERRVAIAVGLTIVPQIDNPVLVLAVSGVLALVGPLLPVAPHLRQLGPEAASSWAERRRLRASDRRERSRLSRRSLR